MGKWITLGLWLGCISAGSADEGTGLFLAQEQLSELQGLMETTVEKGRGVDDPLRKSLEMDFKNSDRVRVLQFDLNEFSLTGRASKASKDTKVSFRWLVKLGEENAALPKVIKEEAASLANAGRSFEWIRLSVSRGKELLFGMHIDPEYVSRYTHQKPAPIYLKSAPISWITASESAMSKAARINPAEWFKTAMQRVLGTVSRFAANMP